MVRRAAESARRADVTGSGARMPAGRKTAKMPAAATPARQRERWDEGRTGKRHREGGSPKVDHGVFSLRLRLSRRAALRFKLTDLLSFCCNRRWRAIHDAAPQI
jgi:hypothetical protein